jgi:hypothetical protein
MFTVESPKSHIERVDCAWRHAPESLMFVGVAFFSTFTEYISQDPSLRSTRLESRSHVVQRSLLLLRL